MEKKPKLSLSQQKVYDYLVYKSKEGIPPTIREICQATGFKSTSTVHCHLKSLEKLGYIKRNPGLTRSMKVAKEGEPMGISVPIIGTVAAGEPIYAYEDELGYVTVDRSLKRGRELYALKIQGNSMIDAGIFNGDVVVFVKQSTAENGEIVVAMIDDSATVKRFYREDGHFRLQPENPEYEPIIADDVQILGRIVAMVRNYEE